MDVYFVRHGETELGKHLRHQSKETPLASTAVASLLPLRDRIALLNPTHVVTSDYTRAIETAHIITPFSLVPTISPLFHEVVRPSSLSGSSHFSLRTFWYVFLSTLFCLRTKWRYEDAENYRDVQSRVKKAREYLESHNTDDVIVVVTHSMYITILVSYLVYGRMLHVKDLFFVLLHIERIKNGEVVHLTYVTETKKWDVAQKGSA